MAGTPILAPGAVVAVCNCGASANNTGVGCVYLKQVEKIQWLTSLYDSTGTPNFIDLTTAIDDTVIKAMINNVDPLARAYPLPESKNIDDVRDKTVTEDMKDGTKYFVRLGIRNYTTVFPPESASPVLDASLQGFRCYKKLGKYTITADGWIWGVISADGTKLYPAPIDPGSIAVTPIYTTDTTVQKLQLEYNYHPSFDDRLVRGIPQPQLGGNINPLDYVGLKTAYIQFVSCTTTQLVVNLLDAFGETLDPEMISGILIGGFALQNLTTNLAVTIASLDESPDGTYTFTFTAQTSGNLLQLTPTLSGYDWSGVIATNLTVS